MSTYGDMLSAFPEVIKEYQFFSMKPKTGGGYLNRVNLNVKTGAFIRGAKSYMSIQGEGRAANETGVFYCYENKTSELVRQGTYFEDEGQLFVITDDQTFAKEAGFGAYSCQLVQGPTDEQVENLNVEQRVITDFVL